MSSNEESKQRRGGGSKKKFVVSDATTATAREERKYERTIHSITGDEQFNAFESSSSSTKNRSVGSSKINEGEIDDSKIKGRTQSPQFVPPKDGNNVSDILQRALLAAYNAHENHDDGFSAASILLHKIMMTLVTKMIGNNIIDDDVLRVGVDIIGNLHFDEDGKKFSIQFDTHSDDESTSYHTSKILNTIYQNYGYYAGDEACSLFANAVQRMFMENEFFSNRNLLSSSTNILGDLSTIRICEILGITNMSSINDDASNYIPSISQNEPYINYCTSNTDLDNESSKSKLLGEMASLYTPTLMKKLIHVTNPLCPGGKDDKTIIGTATVEGKWICTGPNDTATSDSGGVPSIPFHLIGFERIVNNSFLKRRILSHDSSLNPSTTTTSDGGVFDKTISTTESRILKDGTVDEKHISHLFKVSMFDTVRAICQLTGTNNSGVSWTSAWNNTSSNKGFCAGAPMSSYDIILHVPVFSAFSSLGAAERRLYDVMSMESMMRSSEDIPSPSEEPTLFRSVISVWEDEFTLNGDRMTDDEDEDDRIVSGIGIVDDMLEQLDGDGDEDDEEGVDDDSDSQASSLASSQPDNGESNTIIYQYIGGVVDPEKRRMIVNGVNIPSADEEYHRDIEWDDSIDAYGTFEFKNVWEHISSTCCRIINVLDSRSPRSTSSSISSATAGPRVETKFKLDVRPLVKYTNDSNETTFHVFKCDHPESTKPHDILLLWLLGHLPDPGDLISGMVLGKKSTLIVIKNGMVNNGVAIHPVDSVLLDSSNFATHIGVDAEWHNTFELAKCFQSLNASSFDDALDNTFRHLSILQDTEDGCEDSVLTPSLLSGDDALYNGIYIFIKVIMKRLNSIRFFNHPLTSSSVNNEICSKMVLDEVSHCFMIDYIEQFWHIFGLVDITDEQARNDDDASTAPKISDSLLDTRVALCGRETMVEFFDAKSGKLKQEEIFGGSKSKDIPNYVHSYVHDGTVALMHQEMLKDIGIFEHDVLSFLFTSYSMANSKQYRPLVTYAGIMVNAIYRRTPPHETKRVCGCTLMSSAGIQVVLFERDRCQ